MTESPGRGDYRIVIVDDHALFAEALELSLSLEGYDVRRLRLPETGGSATAVKAAALRQHPRLVLLDLDLGEFGDADAIIAPLVEAGVRVVVITGSADQARWGACVHHGASKILSKSAPLHETIATVARLHAGLPVMGREELEQHLAAWRAEDATSQHHRRQLESLTPRESEVLSHLMAGMTVREIAHESVVSEATVRTQVKSILAKLDVSSQLAAVGIAHRTGWRGRPRHHSSRVPHLGHAPPLRGS